MHSRFERLLLWTARLSLPRGSREWMGGDLEEDYRRMRAERGTLAAARWLAAETVRNAIDRMSRLGGGEEPHRPPAAICVMRSA